MPTILVSKDIKEIKNALSKDDRVVVTTCASCPEKCGIKVPEIVNQLAKEFKIAGVLKYPVACNVTYVEAYKERLARMNPTVMVLLDCDAAALSHKILYPDLKVVKGVTTLGFAFADPDEGYAEVILPFPGNEKYEGMRLKLYDGEIIREGIGGRIVKEAKKSERGGKNQ